MPGKNKMHQLYRNQSGKKKHSAYSDTIEYQMGKNLQKIVNPDFQFDYLTPH